MALPFTTAAQTEPLLSACLKCHTQARSQPATSMGHALETVEESDVLRKHPFLTVTLGGYSYRIERKGVQSHYSVSDGAETLTMPIRWAMGASTGLGQTYILEKDGEMYETVWILHWVMLAPTQPISRKRPDVFSAPTRNGAVLMSRHECDSGEATHARKNETGSAMQALSRGRGSAPCRESAE